MSLMILLYIWFIGHCRSPLDDINEMRLSREIDKWWLDLKTILNVFSNLFFPIFSTLLRILSQYEYKNNLLCPKCQSEIWI